MALAAVSSVPGIPHAPEISRAERLAILEAMAASRARRAQTVKLRRRARMPQLGEPGDPGWEGLEAAAARAMRSGDALVAGSDWLCPLAGERRVGGPLRLTDVPAAALGAALAAPSGSAVVALCGPGWDEGSQAALGCAVAHRAPLVLLVAAPAEVADAVHVSAGACGAPFELVDGAEVEAVSLAAETAGTVARAGQGPSVVACRPAPATKPRRPWQPREPSADPIERYAGRLLQLGIPPAELRSAVAEGLRQ